MGAEPKVSLPVPREMMRDRGLGREFIIGMCSESARRCYIYHFAAFKKVAEKFMDIRA